MKYTRSMKEILHFFVEKGGVGELKGEFTCQAKVVSGNQEDCYVEFDIVLKPTQTSPPSSHPS